MLFDHIRQLCDLPGPSGLEQPVMDHLASIWGRLGKTDTTPVGNLWCHIGGNGPRVLLQAHADEISLLVKSITEDGFIRVTRGTYGSENDTPPSFSFPFQRVTILTDEQPVTGIIAMSHGHARTTVQVRKRELDWIDLFIDIGARSHEQVTELGIRPGTPVIFATQTMRLGDAIMAKALDDRGGLAIMTELAARLDPQSLNCDLYLGATVQEEIGLAGAPSLINAVQPDLVIGLEVGLSGDIPTLGLQHIPVRLGGGPILVVKDTMVHYDRRLTAEIARTADTAGIAVQHAVFGAFASDGREFIMAGIPTALIAFPTRYTHTPWETASLSDMEATVELMCSVLTSPGLFAR